MKKGVLRITRGIFVGLCVVLATVFLHAENPLLGELVIEGTGDSQILLRTLARYFEERYPGTIVRVPESTGSSGGIKAVGMGNAELGRVARPIKEEERMYNLTYTVFAMSPVVLIVHPSVKGIDNLTAEEIVDIYSGTITHWQQLGGPAHKLYPIGREVGDSSRSVLEAHIPKFQNIREPVAKVYYTTPEAMQAIGEHEYTIGYVPGAMINNIDVRTIAVDGIAPSVENMRQNRYTMVTPLGIVYKDSLSPLAQAFVEFLFSPEAHEVIEEYGCLPMEKMSIDSNH